MATVAIYTDGACKSNPGIGGWGVVFNTDVGPGVEITSEYSGAEPQTTNNAMELTAVIRALELLNEQHWKGPHICIYTDSQYVQRGVLGWICSWKHRYWRTQRGAPVINTEMWKRLSALARERKIEWNWISRHSGNKGTERADTLANQAIEDYIKQS